MEIGTAGMIKSDQIESMGSDLLGGGGFMKDMAPLQGAIHGAVQTAANSYEQMKSIKDTAAAELKNAKKEAAAELENAKKEALDLAASELENAKKEAAAELENAKKEAAAELEKMKKELEAAKASALTSKKVIEEAVSDVKGGTKLSSIPEEQKGKKK
jgi:F0F1-type ATP synthase membrane subunit b/b'